MMEREEFCEQVRMQEVSMYRYALGVLRNTADAEDAVGEAVLRAYEHLGQLKDVTCFRAWVKPILGNVTRTTSKKKGRVAWPGDMALSETGVQQEGKELWYLVMELSREFRDVVILYYYDGFRVKEIARMLKVSEGTVKSRLNRAREKLKRMWEGMC